MAKKSGSKFESQKTTMRAADRLFLFLFIIEYKDNVGHTFEVMQVHFFLCKTLQKLKRGSMRGCCKWLTSLIFLEPQFKW